MDTFSAHYQTETPVNSNSNAQLQEGIDAAAGGEGGSGDDSLSGGGGVSGGNTTPATEENSLFSSSPSNLLVTFLEYCSIVMQVKVVPRERHRAQMTAPLLSSKCEAFESRS